MAAAIPSNPWLSKNSITEETSGYQRSSTIFRWIVSLPAERR